MLSEWIDHALELSKVPAEFYSGARKILRNQSITFKHPLHKAIKLEHSGYTKSKQTMLTKNYLHAESRDFAVELWKRRCEQRKYGSVGFSTYNHLVKKHGLDREARTSSGQKSRASVMGPCIQAVTLTWLNTNEIGIDAFYRTTEFYKKFPADLVFLRDVLLPPFNLDEFKHVTMTCQFANITLHPMYFVTILPNVEDPIDELNELRKADKYFHDWVVKWTARYLCDEHHRGIAKFAQAMRVHMDARRRIKPAELRKLQAYMLKHHPGHRNDYKEPDDDGDDSEG